jgi:hypothetical protein
MEKVEQMIGAIQEKIEQLVEENQKLKKRVLELIEESSYYKGLSKDKEKALENLEARSEAMTMAKHMVQDSDSEQARGKIDELVREIDRCIDLLSR